MKASEILYIAPDRAIDCQVSRESLSDLAEGRVLSWSADRARATTSAQISPSTLFIQRRQRTFPVDSVGISSEAASTKESEAASI